MSDSIYSTQHLYRRSSVVHQSQLLNTTVPTIFASNVSASTVCPPTDAEPAAVPTELQPHRCHLCDFQAPLPPCGGADSGECGAPGDADSLRDPVMEPTVFCQLTRSGEHHVSVSIRAVPAAVWVYIWSFLSHTAHTVVAATHPYWNCILHSSEAAPVWMFWLLEAYPDTLDTCWLSREKLDAGASVYNCDRNTLSPILSTSSYVCRNSRTFHRRHLLDIFFSVKSASCSAVNLEECVVSSIQKPAPGSTLLESPFLLRCREIYLQRSHISAFATQLHNCIRRSCVGATSNTSAAALVVTTDRAATSFVPNSKNNLNHSSSTATSLFHTVRRRRAAVSLHSGSWDAGASYDHCWGNGVVGSHSDTGGASLKQLTIRVNSNSGPTNINVLLKYRGKLYAAVGKHLRIYSSVDGRHMLSLPGKNRGISAMDVHDNLVICGCEDGIVNVFDSYDKELVHVSPGRTRHQNTVTGIHFLSNQHPSTTGCGSYSGAQASHFVTTSLDGTVRFWDTASNACVRILGLPIDSTALRIPNLHQHPITCSVALSSNILISCGLQQTQNSNPTHSNNLHTTSSHPHSGTGSQSQGTRTRFSYDFLLSYNDILRHLPTSASAPLYTSSTPLSYSLYSNHRDTQYNCIKIWDLRINSNESCNNQLGCAFNYTFTKQQVLGFISSMAALPMQNQLMAGCTNNMLAVWDLRNLCHSIADSSTIFSVLSSQCRSGAKHHSSIDTIACIQAIEHGVILVQPSTITVAHIQYPNRTSLHSALNPFYPISFLRTRDFTSPSLDAADHPTNSKTRSNASYSFFHSAFFDIEAESLSLSLGDTIFHYQPSYS
uniref:F-box/WD repeat-containing protein 7 n=1 Tax=Lygus hesperus TaxID=30085 RepID=A0A0A9YG23_LYGHE